MSSARRMFSTEEVTALHAEVLAIVAELDPPEDLRALVYGSVVAMCGQHQVGVPTVGVPMGPNGLPI